MELAPSMETYLERYLRGEYREVWAELVARGNDIRLEPLLVDAEAVARELMERAKHNVSLLANRLQELQYRFAYPDQVWIPPDAQHLAVLDSLERRFGPIPMVVRAWYEIVGSVNFMGAHPKLSRYSGIDWGGSDRLGCYSDPLVLGTPRGSADRYTPIPYYASRAADFDEMDRIERENLPPYGLEIGGDAITKANESGSGPTFIMVPNPAFDSPLLESPEWEGTFLVPHLRSCFEWGGFPGLRSSSYPGQACDSSLSKAEIEFLTRDLLPL